MSGPIVHLGLPYAAESGALTRAAQELGANTLISMGAFFRKGALTAPSLAPWRLKAPALDSAGFTAMKLGGYRWTVAEHVAFVVTHGGGAQSGAPFPWLWWSAMDYCCEPEIAADRAEIERRIEATVESYRETLAELDWWREEGDTDTPDPLPILQGRTPADYVRCAERLAAVCRDGRLPALVGIGSVCRRSLRGPDGLLAILATLDRALPKGVRLHLFGVKGVLLDKLGPFAHRVASVDSLAWDFRARKVARAEKRPNTVAHRAAHMRAWYRQQVARSKTTSRPAQLSLFSVAA